VKQAPLSFPWPLRLAEALAVILGLYTGSTFCCALPMGLFVGPHILIPALVCGVLAPSFLWSGLTIRARKPLARWVLAGTSLLVVVALAVAFTAWPPPDDPREWGTFLVPLASCAVIVICLTGRPAHAWFAGPKTTGLE
jgi:peptidoglycan/LPS O-acetylase OafA/YrhL